MQLPAVAMALCCLAWTTLSAQTNVLPKGIVPRDSKYEALATALKAKGMNFDQLFEAMCKAALTNAAANPRLRLDDEIRAMFGGMWQWGLNGGSPEFQGQNDKALHFLGGGAFEGYFDLGRSAAIIKEDLDRRNLDNFFDMDDMAATMMGARWVDLATSANTNQARAWVELWASGKSTLSRSLPKLHWGHMEPGVDAPPEKIKAVLADINAAMVPPDVPK